MIDFEISKESSLPLHLQLLEELRHKVLTGIFQPHERLPSEWELVERLKISRATIQRAWQTAEEEGLIYRLPGKGTFIAAPRPATTVRTAVGLISPDFRGTFAANTVRGAERILRARGFHLQVASTDYRIEEENRVLRKMREDGVSGFMIWAVKGEDSQRLLATLAETVPVVLIDRPVGSLKLPCVTSNHYAGAMQAMEHLIGLGHRRIVFLARPHLDLWTVRERYRAYQDAMRGHEIEPLPPVLIGTEYELSSYDAYTTSDDNTLQPLIDLLRSKDRPTAIFAVNDWMAMRALRAASIAEVQVPRQLSLVGFDNLDVVNYLSPPLTTIAQNADLMGAEAARRLLALIDGEKATEVLTLLPTELIVRGSTGVPMS